MLIHQECLVAIVGKSELERNVAKVKDMIKGKEVEVKLIDLIKLSTAYS